ncbi:MAG TPA: hypothetical protein VIP98_10675 [Microlunatus sp.]
MKWIDSLRWRGPALLAITVLLAGCDVSGGHVAGMAPGSSNAPSTSAAQPTAASSSSSPADGAGSAGKPSIDRLQAALADYFGLQPKLTSDQVRRAAACAAYPSFQELSRAGLSKIIKGDASELTGGDATAFQHVVTECVTAAGGPGN